MSDFAGLLALLPRPGRRWAGVGCLVASLLVGTFVGFVWSLLLVMDMAEGGYRSVPAGQQWLVSLMILARWLVPIGLAVALVTLVARPQIRWFVLKVGVVAGGLVAVMGVVHLTVGII